MIDPVAAKAVIKAIVLPPNGPLLLSIIGLALRRKFPRGGMAMAWTGVVVLLALSLPAVAFVLVRSLDSSGPFDPALARDAQAVVILGGGVRHDAPEYGGDTLGELTLERVRYGARVARMTGLPVLLSGGSVFYGQPEATLMRQALEEEFGVRVRWTEARSRTTHENARYSAAMLRQARVDSVVLVAHSFDMPRARAEFAAAGIRTYPAPTGIPSANSLHWTEYVPSIAGLRASYYALYEILADLARRAQLAGG